MSTSLKPRAQNQAWERLLAMADALPQGLILLGPSGVGKRRAAKALYQWLHCAKNPRLPRLHDEEADPSLFGAPEPEADLPAARIARAIALEGLPCGECTSCRKIAEGRHADLIEILPKGENIPVDDLREMKKSLYFPPLEGRFRFVILDEAHKLNASSANTLLKTLEEPPAHTRFLLVTHERGLLLPTIVSRCQFVYFAPLDTDTLQSLLHESGIEIPPKLLPLCLDLMSGGMERASLLASEKTVAFLNELMRLLSSSTELKRWESVVQLAEQLATAGEEWRLELLLDVLVRAAHHEAVAPETYRTSGGARHALELSLRALEASQLRRKLTRNANRKLVALAAASLAAGESA